MHRMLELAGNGEIGELVRVEARMLMPPPPAGDLRWDADVAGGGLMDVGLLRRARHPRHVGVRRR